MDCLVDLKGYRDERGLLVPIEAMKQVPFDIKRIYYLTGLKNDLPRGFHAHKKTRQFAICLAGSCRFIMDDGKEKAEFLLSGPLLGIRIEPMVWHEMEEFSRDCIVLILTSDYYDEKDYIRDYTDFKRALL